MENTDFKVAVNQMCRKFKTFVVEKKRAKVKIFGNDGVVMCFNQKKKNDTFKKENNYREIVSLIGNVQRSCDKYIQEKQFDIPKIASKNLSYYTNRDLYRSLPKDTLLAYVDICHCFWRIAFNDQIISKKLYENVLEKPHLKIYRNLALACIIAPIKREYYRYGKKLYEIAEDRKPYRIIYDNIRFKSYNLVGDVYRKFEGKTIGYRTDAVIVFPEIAKRVKSIFEKNNFKSKITYIRKYDDSYFAYEETGELVKI